jgi:hypothetical protein
VSEERIFDTIALIAPGSHCWSEKHRCSRMAAL